MKEIPMKRMLLAVAICLCAMAGYAQSGGSRVSVGIGALYEKGFDATLSVEHETKNHNAWEYFLNGYIQYAKDKEAGHITKDSFWRNYRTWAVGVAYKPCVYRGRNTYGSLRIGASGGSDTREFMGWAHVGYEHNYVLRGGWAVYWQAKTDLCVNGKDLFRTGVVIGVKRAL